MTAHDRRVNVVITALGSDSPTSRPLEIVERKGLGHPDTICDALVENLSRALCRAYLERFGLILHHNVDKALLVGGLARPRFGGGELLEPIEIHLAGRATRELRGASIDVDAIAREATSTWLGENLRHLRARDVRIHTHIRPTSPDLAELFVRSHATGAAPLANDTSFGVGFAPLDRLERTVLAADAALHDADLRRAMPFIGDDTKVMGVRTGEALALTVACAFVGAHVRDLGDYLAKKAILREHLRDASARAAGSAVDVVVNSADGDSDDSVYLTVTGLSAEGGDDGQVGRGNRINGLITPGRPMSLEAAAGKNPVSHVGKLYNLAAERLARALCEELDAIDEAYCALVSRIGRPIDEPWVAEIALRTRAARAGDATLDEATRARIDAIAHEHLASLRELWRELVTGDRPLW